MDTKPIAVTGATGYVGGRLIPLLLKEGYRIRAAGRDPAKLGCRPWAQHPNVELVQADTLDRAAMTRALQGCRAVYYLVHSMIARKEKFIQADRQSARNLVAATAANHVEQIIYLGGLGDLKHPRISKHLISRHEVARILKQGPVPITDLRAAMILGSGSASFEILRYLVERLPVMLTPKWVHTPCQPIAISDVLAYLVGCLKAPGTIGRTFDIGGPDILTYKQIIDIFAEEAGLPPRKIVPVPLLTPQLSAQWIHLITPVPAAIAVPLAEGLSTPVICRNDRIHEFVPHTPVGCRESIRIALDRVAQEKIDTCWTDAGYITTPEWAYCGDADYAGGTINTCGYRMRLAAKPEAVWQPVARLGGRQGWYFGRGLWWLRGKLDSLLGGTGIRRGRRHPSDLRVGDAVDFWRVVQVEPNRRLLLVADHKLPGEALLDFTVTPVGANQVDLTQTARFLPRGLSGLLYWYAFYPFHQFIIAGMLKAVAQKINAPVIAGPTRYTLKIPNACRIEL